MLGYQAPPQTNKQKKKRLSRIIIVTAITTPPHRHHHRHHHQSVLVAGKPHLGTDRLVRILKAFRAHLIALGVHVRRLLAAGCCLLLLMCLCAVCFVLTASPRP